MESPFIYSEYYLDKDKRTNKEINKELNYDQLGLQGLSFEEARKYIEEDKKIFRKKEDS